MTTAAIIGGGIGGLASAIALRNAGLHVDVYEQAPHPSEIGAGLSLWPNGTRALTELGLGAKLGESITPLKALESRRPSGHLLHRTELQPVHQRLGSVSAAMHRGDLFQLLLWEVPPEFVTTNSRLRRLSREEDRTVLHFEDGREATADVVVAADGLNSTVREQLTPGVTPRYAGYGTWRGIVEMERPGDWPPMALVRSLGRGEYFGVGEISPGRYLWYATRNRPLNEPEPGGRRATLDRTFGNWHRPIRELLEATPENNILLHPIYKMSPVKNLVSGSIALLGDAAHPVEPSLGMGACLAIEDAVVLGACFRKNGSIEQALAEYERVRRPRVAKIHRWSKRLAQSEQVTNAAACAARDLVTTLSPPSLTRFLMKAACEFDLP